MGIVLAIESLANSNSAWAELRRGSTAGAREVAAMRVQGIIKKSSNGQSIVEYTLVAAIVTSAVIAMSTYVFRAVQATQQTIQEEFIKSQQ